MSRFDNISIRSKIVLIILIIMIPIIVVHAVISAQREVEILKKEMMEKTITIARLTGNNCTPDLMFDDREQALLSLELLATNNSIEFITLLDKEGEDFASFTYHPILKQLNKVEVQKAFAILNNSRVIVNEPIYVDDEFRGSVLIISNNVQLNAAITNQFMGSLQIMFALIVVVVLISFQVHKLISIPILDLAKLAKMVAEKKDYSVRANSNSRDEIGTLVAGFNSMLNTIESTTVSKKFIDSVIASMLDPLIILDKQGRVKEANFASCKMLEYDRRELIGMNIQDLVDDISIISIRGQYKEANAIKKDGSFIPVDFSVTIIDADNMVCMAHDLSERKTHLNAIKSSLDEKEIMIKEIHHRVKNNLQIITSLLRLQSSFLDDPQALASFNEAQNRVMSMALIHEKLYQTRDFVHINIDEYVRELLQSLISTYSFRKYIELDIESEVQHFSIDTLIPLGLLLNELISNSLKYAFPQKEEGKITIQLKRLSGSECYLVYADNGIGMTQEQFDVTEHSLGMELVKTLSGQLQGEIKHCDAQQGVKFELYFQDQFEEKDKEKAENEKLV